MKKPELSPTSEKIDKIISRIDSGDIRIPAFQRGFVWKQEQIIELLDSIITNYPIGSVLLWYTTDRLNFTRNIAGYLIPEIEIEYPVNYVLDGQQRLSSIYAVFSDKTKQDEKSEQYNPNLDLFEIYYDFENKQFLPKNEVDTRSNKTIPLRNILSSGKVIKILKKVDGKYHDEVGDLISKFNNYEIPVVTIKNREKAEVGIIFERINNTGTKLSTLDLMTAWTWTDDFHLLESTNELQEELEEKGFGGIPHNIILQTISSIIQNDTTTRAILNLSGEQVRDNWKLFCESLKKTIDFLSTEFNCSHLDFLPFHQQIIPITKFFSTSDRPNQAQIDSLKKWFWRTSFSNRYSSGQTTAKMNNDINAIMEIRKNNFKVVDNYPYTITNVELIGSKFSKANPVTRAFLMLMAQYNPTDLVKGTKIDLGSSLSKYNRKEFHHVFPVAFLKKEGYRTCLAK